MSNGVKIKIKDKVYEIKISELGEEKVKIIVNGKEFLFGGKEEKVLIPKTSFLKRDFSKKEILAPITGVISELFVKEGEFVESGQKLVSLSSMKMENEIISDFEGRVKEVLVKKDQKVKEGEVLVILI